MAQRGRPVGAAKPRIARSHPPIWAAFYQQPRQRKARPSLDAQNGMHFPDGGPGGKHVPESRLRAGQAFRLSPSAETASRNKHSNWDALSKRPASGNTSHSGAEFRDAVSVCGGAPNKRPRLAMELGPKAQHMQLILSANSPSAMVVRTLPYPRLRTRL